MTNPPFNVDEVDAEKVKGDKRLPFGLPGVNKAKKVSSANYVWLYYFCGYLNENGRAGVVMSSQASSAGRDEAKVRQKLVERDEVEAHDWSLTPGRYVGVAPEEEDEDFDFEEALRSIHLDLKGLNEEAEKTGRADRPELRGIGGVTTAPPYTITPAILDLSIRIGEAIGRAEEAAVGEDLRLRRINRIRTIRGSLAIEGNTLTEDEITTILDGRPGDRTAAGNPGGP